jgi:hypothetical protein
LFFRLKEKGYFRKEWQRKDLESSPTGLASEEASGILLR